jgi:hypothetical protein
MNNHCHRERKNFEADSRILLEGRVKVEACSPHIYWFLEEMENQDRAGEQPEGLFGFLPNNQ